MNEIKDGNSRRAKEPVKPILESIASLRATLEKLPDLSKKEDLLGALDRMEELHTRDDRRR